MQLEHLSMYQLVEERKLTDLDSTGYLFRHKKSGARLFVVENTDDNKVFSIGFRTPPVDSTGLTHILEHSVLCGSKEFPVKDPFIELAKGSLNTFLNAMTYPDKTVYPVASVNDKDFQNLIHVYLDAVFYPNIYQREEIFKQEGWHYELEDAEGELTVNGVVYNEMKGAFSSPDEVVSREIMNSLYPDTPYGFESGGDPDVIPSLSYEKFLNFHKTYYHPSNSYIFLYGDCDMEEKLLWMDEHYLSHFEAKEIDTVIEMQKPFDKCRVVEKKYSVAEESDEEKNTYLTYNFSCGSCLDRKLYVALDVLEYALITAPGAPLKQALLDAGIGEDINSNTDTGILQPFFSIVAKQCEKEQVEEFQHVIRTTLEKIVKEGFDRNCLLAELSSMEFSYREADFGRFPIGLSYGLQCMDSWLHDDRDPFRHLEQNEIFAILKKEVDTGYFENLVEKYFLNNTHSSIVIVEPKCNLTGETEALLAEKLQAYKNSLTREQIDALVADTKHLKDYQSEPSTQEELETIPLLAVSDIRKEALPYDNTELSADGVKVLKHSYATKGIAYLDLLFNMDDLSEEEIAAASLLTNVLSFVDTDSYNFRDLSNEINIHTGGLSQSVYVYTDARENNLVHLKYSVKVKALYPELEKALNLVSEILTTSKVQDEKRLKEILAQTRSSMQGMISGSGHSLAYMRCSSYFSESAKAMELSSGIAYYQSICDWYDNFEEKKADLIHTFEELIRKIFTPNRLLISLTEDGGKEEEILPKLSDFKKSLFADSKIGAKTVFSMEKQNEGFRTASKVNYVARCGNYKRAGLSYNGALRILKMALSYDYMWNNIRVKGGAYGCMCGFDSVGDSYFVSYRDPHVKSTMRVFEGILDYVENFDASDRDMTKFIIGTVSMMDTPLVASAKGHRSLGAYLGGTTFEEIQTYRDQVLNASQENIRALAPYIRAILDGNYVCAIGDENKIEKDKELFENLKMLS